jgi:predicted secreted protein
MRRSRSIAIVAHCLLDANARVPGIAYHEGVHPVAAALAEKGFGLIQLPCPELLWAGADRARATREDYDTEGFRARARAAAEPVVAQVREFARAGYDVGPLVLVEHSPSCGLATPGVFTEEIERALAPLGIVFAAVDPDLHDDGLESILRAAGSAQ